MALPMEAEVHEELVHEKPRPIGRPEGWPVRFYVCSYHKENFFADDENAILDDCYCCILCEPCENDSLGG